MKLSIDHLNRCHVFDHHLSVCVAVKGLSTNIKIHYRSE